MRIDSPNTTLTAERHRHDAIADLCDRASRRLVGAMRAKAEGDLDARDTLKDALRAALAEAFEEGRRQGIAEELGIRAVVFRDSADRFPWQVFCDDETCVLISPDARDHVVIASDVRDHDEPFFVRAGAVPDEVLHLVRRALVR